MSDRIGLFLLNLEEFMKCKNTAADAIRTAESISLIALPLALAIAFLLHYTTLSDFFTFKLIKPPYSAGHLLQTLTSPDRGFRQYILPHLVGYLALPLFIPASLVLANTVYNWLSSWVVNHRILDLTSGFRVVNRKKFLEFLHLLPNGFSYPTTITMSFLRSARSRQPW